MNLFDGVLKFKGTWRSYQQRVLDRADRYLADGKIHIVAAPGSGKTTLGIELIRRAGSPCLILSPSITIRQQWIARMTESFLLEGNPPDAWFSSSLKNIKPITAITYQALHSCMKHYSGPLDDEEASEDDTPEVVDYTDFDVQDYIARSGIKTVCLDEAHHLRSEWWKALEDFLKNIPGLTLISLTATPPYDTTPAQWKRYIDLCGPIDEEIFTPELVQEGSLCPHQDYVYFNWPTKEEQQAVRDFTRQAGELYDSLKADPELVRLVSCHRGILSPEAYSEKFLDNPAYFSSLLIFLHENKVPFSSYLTRLTGTKGNFPKLSPRWLETLLQGLLYDDTDSFPTDAVYREQLTGRLKAAGCIRRNKVVLVKNEEVTKVLTASKGKLNSIRAIVASEYENMGEELRLLVLCDFIKKEMLGAVGDPSKPVNEIGAVPIFETLRREGIPGLRIGVLSGSVIILPSDTVEELGSLARKRHCECAAAPLGDTGCSRITVRGTQHHIVALVTELFTRGRIHVLVGTKSLLGEGWDSPCINSLILATYVGSFMLSNQMRGRAIRVFRDRPEKTGNIWHLACILPQKLGGEEGPGGDYETLVRRFNTFLGLSHKNNVIESGIDRLHIDSPLNSRAEVEKCSQTMLRRAADRDGLRLAWGQSLKEIHDTMRVEEETEVEDSLAEPGYLFFNAVLMETLCVLGTAAALAAQIFLRSSVETSSFSLFLLRLLLLFCLFGLLKFGCRIARLCSPQKRMQQAADGILDALIQTDRLEEPRHCRAVTEHDDVLSFCWLKGGTTRDKTLFAECVSQFWGPIDNPRYVLALHGGRRRTTEYYAVPEILGRKKEDALIFARCMKRCLGPFEAVYTRTPEGRRLLLRARTSSFVNKNHRIITNKKKVKSDFE